MDGSCGRGRTNSLRASRMPSGSNKLMRRGKQISSAIVIQRQVWCSKYFCQKNSTKPEILKEFCFVAV